jgi:MFS transporter, ACS family, tartrate transporter
VLVLHCADPSRGCCVSASPVPAPSTIEATTIRKLRLRILPFVFLLYVIAYLDRINIGFAALTMNKELSISSQQFGFLAGIFFFGYFIFEVPSNLLLHRIGARIWIARILITWGVVAVLTGFVQTPHQLYFVRFILGLAEAGYFPGIVLYLTYWFRQREQAQAIALFMAAVPITSIVGAPISGLILDHVHWLGLSSWRWLLILEGVPAVVGGFLTYLLLPNRPVEAKFLTQKEKDWISSELAREERQKLAKRRISAVQVFTNGRVWHLICVGFAFFISVYTLNFWMPQLVKSLFARYSNSIIGILVMIPSVAGLLAMVLVSRRSDRKLERRYHAAVPAIIGGLALLSVGATRSAWLSLALLCFGAAGVYSFYAPFYSLPCEFLTGFSAASGIAFISSVAHLGSFVGPYAMGAINKRTGSFRGGLVLAGSSLFASAMLMLALRQRIAPETEPVATAQRSPVVLPTPDVDS